MIKRVGNKECTLCPLSEKRTQVVQNIVNTDAEIAFIGMMPGTNEDLEGSPFVGRAGKTLKSAIKKASYNPESCSFLNCCLCIHPDNVLTRENYRLCKYNLTESISNMPNLKLLVGLGNDVYKCVMDIGTVTMKNVYLKTFPHKEFSMDFVPIPHPASTLYNPTAKVIAYFEDGVSGAINLLRANKKIEKVKKFISILTSDKLEKALSILDKQSILSVDTETTSLKPHLAEMICISFSFEDRTAISFPWKWGKEKLEFYWNEEERGLIESYFRKFFLSHNKAFISHNNKYDSQIIHKEFGFPIENIRCDTMLLSHLLDSNQPAGLEAVVIREMPENTLGYKSDFWSNITEAEKERGDWWKKKTLEEILDYCAEDTSNTFEVAKIYLRRLNDIH